jgi:hypothetical protein
MGRPRKPGLREPSGRPSRSDRVLHIQRNLDAIRKLSLDAELGTPLGLMLVWEKITRHQYEAGTWFAEARRAADGALGLPPRNPPAQDVSAAGGASLGFDTPEKERARQRAIHAYDQVVAFLRKGSIRHKVLEQVCVHERRPDTYGQVLALVDALDMIVAYRSVRRAA